MNAPAPQARGPLSHLHPHRRRPARWVGAGMLLLAAAAVAFPAATTVAVGGVGGWLLWFAGALMLGVALLTFTGGLRWLGSAVALSAIALGAYLLFNPTTGAFAALLILAGALAIDGSFQLAASFRLRPLIAWRWLLASALTSLAAAAILALGGPERTPQGVAFLLAAAFATTGAALVVTSFTQRAPCPAG